MSAKYVCLANVLTYTVWTRLGFNWTFKHMYDLIMFGTYLSYHCRHSCSPLEPTPDFIRFWTMSGGPIVYKMDEWEDVRSEPLTQ